MLYGRLRRHIIFLIVTCFLFCAGSTNSGYAAGENYTEQSEKLDVVFAVDDSVSMIAKSEMCHNAMCNAVYSGVGSDIRVGSVYVTDKVHSKHYLTSIEDESSYKAIVGNYFDLPRHKEKTKTVFAQLIESGKELFRHQDKTRKRVMILITDGVNTETDSELSEQKKQLKEENIALYCALIGENGKESTFSDLLDARNIFRIYEENMDLMTEKFSDIFYGSRGDVQYQTVSLDEEGKYVFVIPKLNVTRLQTYAKGNHIKITVTSPSAKEIQSNSWVDGFNVFLRVDNPTAGEWTLKIEGDNKKDVKNTKVTMAYYTELTVSGKLTDSDGNSGTLKKNTPCILTADLSDNNGNPYFPDEGAEIKADLYFNDIIGGKRSLYKSLILTQENGKRTSDTFSFDSYGTVDAEIHVLYDDYIDIECMSENIAQIKAEAPYLIQNYQQKVIWTKTENGKSVFTVDIGEFIQDKDSDINELTVDRVTYYNAGNRFAEMPYIENGKLKCTVEKLFGKTESTIVFKDSTNLTVSLKVEGFTVNGTVAGIFFGLILAGLLGAGFYYVFIKPKHGGITNRGEKSRNSELLAERRNEVKEQKAELQANVSELKQHLKLLEGSGIQQYRRNLSALQTTLKEKSGIPQEIIDEMTSEETALLKTVDSKTEMFSETLQSGEAFLDSILSDEQTEQIKDTRKLSQIAEDICTKNEEIKSFREENAVFDTERTFEDENRKLTAKKNKLQSKIPFDITVIFNGNFNRAFKSDSVNSYIASIDNFRVTGGAVMTVKDFLRRQKRENLNIIFIPSENAEELEILFAGRETITADGTVQQTNRVIMTENSRKRISDGTDELIIVVQKRQ